MKGRCSVGDQISNGDEAPDLIEPRLTFVLNTVVCFLSLVMITAPPPPITIGRSLAKAWPFSKQSIS